METGNEFGFAELMATHTIQPNVSLGVNHQIGHYMIIGVGDTAALLLFTDRVAGEILSLQVYPDLRAGPIKYVARAREVAK